MVIIDSVVNATASFKSWLVISEEKKTAINMKFRADLASCTCICRIIENYAFPHSDCSKVDAWINTF